MTRCEFVQVPASRFPALDVIEVSVEDTFNGRHDDDGRACIFRHEPDLPGGPLSFTWDGADEFIQVLGGGYGEPVIALLPIGPTVTGQLLGFQVAVDGFLAANGLQP